jgi:general L-amino acid transport system substrate-binding protein
LTARRSCQFNECDPDQELIGGVGESALTPEARGETMKTTLFSLALAGLAFAAAPASAQTLDQIKQRGMVVCGANTGLAGFGQPDQQGNWTGLDVDYCRALAAAIFDDPSKVRFVPLAAKDRFAVLASGEIDVLIRNTTWTLSRDSTNKGNFGAVNYYDGQGFLIRKSLNVKSALELGGATICVQQGTTTELNLADYLRQNNLQFTPVVFAGSDETIRAYGEGRCDAFTTDASGLYAERLKLQNPDEHMVLPEVISKEPLASMVRHGDDQWLDIVRWTHFAMLTAEELGITQANVQQMADDPNASPEVKRVLGKEGEFGKELGLTNDWIVRIIKHVGNYGESFERNVGAGSFLKIERGQNALWSKGGLQYAPPIR